jgi:hypothetical protein
LNERLIEHHDMLHVRATLSGQQQPDQILAHAHGPEHISWWQQAQQLSHQMVVMLAMRHGAGGRQRLAHRAARPPQACRQRAHIIGDFIWAETRNELDFIIAHPQPGRQLACGGGFAGGWRPAQFNDHARAPTSQDGPDSALGIRDHRR